MNTNIAVAAVLRHVRAPKHVRRGERVKLEVVDTPILCDLGEEVRIRATRYLEDRDNFMKRVGVRFHETTVRVDRVRLRSDGALVDAIYAAVHYLTNIVCPPPRPKAW